MTDGLDDETPALTRTGGAAVRTARRVSMADVARVAGVSAQTVSRVSNGHPGVVEATSPDRSKATGVTVTVADVPE